jgi:hypothetical protein
MDRVEITRLAQEAGFVGMDGEHGGLRRFAALVASAEREAILAVIGDNQCECRCSEVVRDRGQA